MAIRGAKLKRASATRWPPTTGNQQKRRSSVKLPRGATAVPSRQAPHLEKKIFNIGFNQAEKLWKKKCQVCEDKAVIPDAPEVALLRKTFNGKPAQSVHRKQCKLGKGKISASCAETFSAFASCSSANRSRTSCVENVECISEERYVPTTGIDRERPGKRTDLQESGRILESFISEVLKRKMSSPRRAKRRNAFSISIPILSVSNRRGRKRFRGGEKTARFGRNLVLYRGNVHP